MPKKISYWLLITILLTSISIAEAQQAIKIFRIGFLATNFPGFATHEGFRQGLKDFGYVEGKDIVIEWRYAEGNPDRFPELAADLVRLKVDVIVAPNARAALAAKSATKTIPIVFSTTAALDLGLVDSLARPGANITGISDTSMDLDGKRMELLTEVVPSLTRLAVFWPAVGIGASFSLRKIQIPAKALGLQLQSIEVQTPNPDFESAFEIAAKGRAQGLLVIGGPVFNPYWKRIAALAFKHRLPSSFRQREYVEAGGLMSYGVDRPGMYRRRVAAHVVKILKGVKPADLPVEQAMNFEFVINLKTAKALDLTIPPAMLMETDRVIR